MKLKKVKNDYFNNKGSGFIDEGGKRFLVRCFRCGTENYSMEVANGICAWCGYDWNKDKIILDKSE